MKIFFSFSPLQYAIQYKFGHRLLDVRRHQTEDAADLKNFKLVRSAVSGDCFFYLWTRRLQAGHVRLFREVVNHESGTIHVCFVRTGVVCK